MFLKILAIFSLLVGLAFSQSAVVRVGKYPDKERIVLQLDKQVDYRVFTLENPKRLVVDIMEAVSVKLPSGLNARVGKHPWGTRVVIERDFVQVKAFSLKDPFRVVLDVYMAGGHKREEEEELLAILEPNLIRVIRNTEVDKEGKKLVGESKGGRLITQKRVVVVDAGHGGHDPGAIGFMGIREKDVVLAIAKKLARYLEEDGRFKVILTRRDDTFVPLQERALIALRNRADLFISIHADAHPQKLPEARGTTIYAISSEAAQKKRQQIISNNSYASLVFGREDIPSSAKVVLADLAMDVTLNESVVLGGKLARRLSKDLNRDVSFRGIKRAGFAVLKTPGIPSLLVEVGFMTNPKEVLMMSDEEFQQNFAMSLYRAIVEYFFPEERRLTLIQGTYGAGE